MMRILLLSVVVLLGVGLPVAGQDVLAPIGTFLEELTAPAPAGVAAPKPATKPDEPPPPVPRPRPEHDGGPAVVEPPSPAAEEPAEERVYQAACPAVVAGLVAAEMAPPLSDGICGERSPLLVTGVLVRGRMLPLSSSITTNCQVASALPAWLDAVDGYAEAALGSPLAGVTTGTSYQCRARVSAEPQFTSEHGFANAVDVTGFTLADGRTLEVAADWAGADGRLLKLAHDAACAQFMTVLGPEANAEHKDHLHLDMGCHGTQCRARICE